MATTSAMNGNGDPHADVVSLQDRLTELTDGIITAANELRRLTAELKEGRRAGPGG